jgi:hypothetical protein
VRCLDNGHDFTADVWQLGHESEESGPQDIIWRVETTDGVTCPYCDSRVVPVEE